MTIYLKSVLDLLSLKCCVFDLAYVIATNLNRKSEVLSVSGLVNSRIIVSVYILKQMFTGPYIEFQRVGHTLLLNHECVLFLFSSLNHVISYGMSLMLYLMVCFQSYFSSFHVTCVFSLAGRAWLMQSMWGCLSWIQKETLGCYESRFDLNIP